VLAAGAFQPAGARAVFHLQPDDPKLFAVPAKVYTDHRIPMDVPREEAQALIGPQYGN